METNTDSRTDLQIGLFKLRFRALGTFCEVQFRSESVSQAKEFRSRALSWLKDFEATWSRFRPESLICRINAAAGVRPVPLSPEEMQIIDLCDHVFRVSGGAIDPTSLPLTQLWDQGEIPTQKTLVETMSLVSWPKVERSDQTIYLPEKMMALEIGGFGKEFAVDQLVTLAQGLGITDCLVDLGRDLRAIGKPPHGDYWIAGIEDAKQKDETSFRIALEDCSLATSGNGRRFREIAGRSFGHIIDPRTGSPAETKVLTASCLSSNCLDAGLYATMATIFGAENAMEKINTTLGVEGILQTRERPQFSTSVHKYVLTS